MYFSFLETAYENDRLKTVGHNGMNYTFGYDSFGNLTQAQAGSRTLVTNTFKMNGTQLKNPFWAITRGQAMNMINMTVLSGKNLLRAMAPQ